MKKNNLFEIGNCLNNDKSWSLEKDDKKPMNKEILLPAKHFLYFKKEKRRGKVVTLVGEFFLSKDHINKLLCELKKSLGAGGRFKEGFMELQGECQNKAKEFLLEKEFRLK